MCSFFCSPELYSKDLVRFNLIMIILVTVTIKSMALKTLLLNPFCCTTVLLDFCLTDSAGPDRVSPHVPPDEVHPPVQRNAKAVHLHANDRQLVSPYFAPLFVTRPVTAAASRVSPLCQQRAARQRIQQHARAVKDQTAR